MVWQNLQKSVLSKHKAIWLLERNPLMLSLTFYLLWTNTEVTLGNGFSSLSRFDSFYVETIFLGYFCLWFNVGGQVFLCPRKWIEIFVKHSRNRIADGILDDTFLFIKFYNFLLLLPASFHWTTSEFHMFSQDPAQCLTESRHSMNVC